MQKYLTKVVISAFILILLLPACRREVPTPTVTRSSPISTSTPMNTSAPIAAPFVPSAGEAIFQIYENNPVLTRGETDTWDSGFVFSGRVVFHNDTYHLFYNGSTDLSIGSVAIGYATSVDGRSFTKSNENPILADDERGFDAIQVSDGVPLVEDDTWVLYYNASGQPGPGGMIGRATASSPTGPWKRLGEPVLRSGNAGSWDGGFIIPQSIISLEEGYVMYYAGGTGQPNTPAMIGRATSPDGVNWEKYDNPDTTEVPFAQSDPVLQTGASGDWDGESLWGCSVLKTSEGWEMFYGGSHSGVVKIGYATSKDGIQWIKSEKNPLLAASDDPVAAGADLQILESPSAVIEDTTYLVYYDYGFGDRSGIGVATGIMGEK